MGTSPKAIKHPEEGKVVDMNDSVRKETGVEDRKFEDISDKWLWKSRTNQKSYEYRKT